MLKWVLINPVDVLTHSAISIMSTRRWKQELVLYQYQYHQFHSMSFTVSSWSQPQTASCDATRNGVLLT